MTMTASIRLTHQSTDCVLTNPPRTRAGGGRSCPRHLDRRVQVGGVLLRDARDPVHEAPRDPGAELDGRAVRADAHGVAGTDPEQLRVGDGELDLRLGPL